MSSSSSPSVSSVYRLPDAADPRPCGQDGSGGQGCQSFSGAYALRRDRRFALAHSTPYGPAAAGSGAQDACPGPGHGSQGARGAAAPGAKSGVSDSIADLLDALDLPETVSGYAELAVRLSAVAHKDPPWSWRYPRSVRSGTVQASPRFRRAIEALGAELDGAPPLLAQAHEVTVLSINGNLEPGTLVLGSTKPCAYPACAVRFVPRVPWQRYHSIECRRLDYRRGANRRGEG